MRLHNLPWRTRRSRSGSSSRIHLEARPTSPVVRSPGRSAAAWGQPLVVDNRAGAAGTSACRRRESRSPDGYTLVVGTFGGLVSGPALLGANVPYDPVNDFAPMGLAVYTPWVLVAHPGAACEERKGAGRARESVAGQAQLRIDRHRHAEPPRHGVADGPRRDRHAARAVSRRGPGGRRFALRAACKRCSRARPRSFRT